MTYFYTFYEQPYICKMFSLGEREFVQVLTHSMYGTFKKIVQFKAKIALNMCGFMFTNTV